MTPLDADFRGRSRLDWTKPRCGGGRSSLGSLSCSCPPSNRARTMKARWKGLANPCRSAVEEAGSHPGHRRPAGVGKASCHGDDRAHRTAARPGAGLLTGISMPNWICLPPLPLHPYPSHYEAGAAGDRIAVLLKVRSRAALVAAEAGGGHALHVDAESPEAIAQAAARLISWPGNGRHASGYRAEFSSPRAGARIADDMLRSVREGRRRYRPEGPPTIRGKSPIVSRRFRPREAYRVRCSAVGAGWEECRSPGQYRVRAPAALT